MKRLWLVVGALTLGCGADETEEPELKGIWLAEAGPECVLGAAFSPGGPHDSGDHYEASLVCKLEGGGYGVQVSSGSYSDYGDSLRVWFTHSTCPEKQRVADMDYRLEDQRLSIKTPTGFVLFERSEDDGRGSGVVDFGCFAADGTFTAQGLQLLP